MTIVDDPNAPLEERAEEALEHLWAAHEEAARRSAGREPEAVQLPADDPHRQALPELRRHELVLLDDVGERDGDGDGQGPARAATVRFTPAGRAAARSIVRRHRLAERLMVDVLDLQGDIVNQVACRFEHLVHQGLDESICTLLGHPRVCPHGKPIPEGPCCRRRASEVAQLVRPLSELRPGQRGTIAYLHSDVRPRMDKLLAMGVLPGAPITLRRRFPTYVFQVDYSQFAVDEQVAAAVFVRLTA